VTGKFAPTDEDIAILLREFTLDFMLKGYSILVIKSGINKSYDNKLKVFLVFR
jgi:hypothetical protein